MRRLGFTVVLLAVFTWMTVAAVRVEGAAPPPAAPAAAVQAPAAAAPDIYKAVYDGWKWWHVYCYRCHGTNAVATTMAPDLLDPNRKMGRAAFARIVRSGVPDKGMQGWEKLLDAKQIGDLYVYVRARADKVLPPGRVDEVGPGAALGALPPDGRVVEPVASLARLHLPGPTYV